MFKQLKMKIAARRVEKNKKRNANRRTNSRPAAGFGAARLNGWAAWAGAFGRGCVLWI